MRHYESIWNNLKNLPAKEAETVGVSVTASRPLHPRIVKAVKKEKHADLGYRILLEDRRATLSTARNHSILTFFLTITYGIGDI